MNELKEVMSAYKKSYWEEEQFEDLVSRSLIAMYESDINKKCKKVPYFIKVSPKEIQEVRKSGCYFPPYDRENLDGIVDIQNDGLPSQAFISYVPTRKLEWCPREYLRLAHMKKISSLPFDVKAIKNGTPYKIFLFQFTELNKLFVQKSYITIDKDGEPSDTYAINPTNKKKVLLACTKIDYEESEEAPLYAYGPNAIRTDMFLAASIIGLYQDRRYLWNVRATERKATALFGVYEEQIKSLFYARELPVTATGRKRPILHWVNAHQRRIKNGVDVDIEKHLRGTEEFIFNGTKFKITNPIRDGRKNND